MQWNHMRPEELRAASADDLLVVVSVGSTEFNGWHIPLGLDSLIGRHFNDRLAGRADCVVLPPIDYGISSAFKGFPGTVWLRPQTLTDLMVDLLAGARACGFRRFLILNNHGPNFACVENAVRELGLHEDALVLSAWPGQVMHTVLTRRGVDASELGHSKEPSTSLMLALHPDLVGVLPVDPAKPAEGGSLEWQTSNTAHFQSHALNWITDVARATDDGQNVGHLNASSELGADLLSSAERWLDELVRAVRGAPLPSRVTDS